MRTEFVPNSLSIKSEDEETDEGGGEGGGKEGENKSSWAGYKAINLLHSVFEDQSDANVGSSRRYLLRQSDREGKKFSSQMRTARESESERATSELATDGNRPGRISLGIDSFPELHKYRIVP